MQKAKGLIHLFEVLLFVYCFPDYVTYFLTVYSGSTLREILRWYFIYYFFYLISEE